MELNYLTLLRGFRDIDLHPSEENTVVLMALLRFGINLKEQDLLRLFRTKDTRLSTRKL
jgi:uncharacterized protein YehS (DUF1456 family)